MGAVSLDYCEVAPDLRGHLSVYYEFRADVPLFEDVERAGLAQARVLLAGSGAYTFADHTVTRAAEAHILGPSTGMTRVCVAGPFHLFGVGLLPAGWGNLMNFDASMLVNRVVDASALLGSAFDGFADRLRAAPTIADKARLADTLARGLIARGQVDARRFTTIVEDWLAASPSPQVDALVAACGLSRRHVERECNKYYGSPPKLLARKYRALRAAMALARGDEVAHDLLAYGFYDQSHFIREIKQFTGVTPGKLASDLPMLARLTLKRGAIEGLVPISRRA